MPSFTLNPEGAEKSTIRRNFPGWWGLGITSIGFLRTRSRAHDFQPPRGHFCVEESVDGSRVVKGGLQHVGLRGPKLAGWIEADSEAVGHVALEECCVALVGVRPEKGGPGMQR